MEREHSGKLEDGNDVERVVIRGGGLTAKVMTWGSVLQDLRLEGHEPPLVLGFETFEHYPVHSRYFGATAGRCANRIRDGRFMLNGKQHQVDRNFLGKHHLHGGSQGIGKRNWAITDLAKDRVTLSISCQDGEMGYPGNLDITVTYALLDNGVLDITFDAKSDADTVCNLAHHSYFNLGGGSNVLDHELTVHAPHYLPVDEELIPTGEIAPVDDTLFDFRTAKSLDNFSNNAVLDHNFCLSKRRLAIREIAALESRKSGVSMAVWSTEPGLQVYDGANLDVPVTGLDGRPMKAHAGIALEPQTWPDAINHEDWFQPVLQAGDPYRQHTQYVFRKGSES